MPGSHINQHQVTLYMQSRSNGHSQASAAAKSGFSDRTARRIDKQGFKPKSARSYRTRVDPLGGLFEQEVVPLLQQNKKLQPITIFELLQTRFPEHITAQNKRTLQRRIRAWHAHSGANNEVMFQQKHLPAALGICDYTVLKNVSITVQGQFFSHRLFHYRLVIPGTVYSIQTKCN